MTDRIPPPDRCDLAVVGGGIVGLAVAREALIRAPGLTVVVLEKEPVVGAHQTSHNSGVVHAGIYYPPGSLKARLCREGADELYGYCADRGVPVRRSGKLVIAAAESELPRLDELERRGRANGVPGLRRLGPDELRQIEPHATGVAALHSPATGVVDFSAVARSLARDVTERGGTVATLCGVTGTRAGHSEIALAHARGDTTARGAVFCAGAFADRVAVAAGAPADPRIVPFRGAWLRVRPERAELVRGLIYPVPDPSLPFLGVHLTRGIDDEVLVGPTALLAGGREAYGLWQVSARDLGSTLAWPGTWRMARRWWRTGVAEVRHAALPRTLATAAARFVPELQPEDLAPGPAGVRAQALSRDGRLVEDFVVSRTERALHVRNAPSPAATASLAIARLVVDQVPEATGLAV